MKIRVLGSSGAEFPGFNPPAFLIDKKLLVDAGTIGSCLSETAQWKIRHIIITHAHLDHILGIPFLADNIVIKHKHHSVAIIGIAPVLKTLRDNLLNNRVWPDFTKIPDKKNAIIKLMVIRTAKTIKIEGYKVTAYKVNHSVPASGYLIEDRNGKRLVYTGDTGPTTSIWKEACKNKVHGAIIEVSFPNSMEAMAEQTGHMTPGLLSKEIKKMRTIPDLIFITHPKPQHLRTIRNEIAGLGMSNIKILRDGETINI